MSGPAVTGRRVNRENGMPHRFAISRTGRKLSVLAHSAQAATIWPLAAVFRPSSTAVARAGRNFAITSAPGVFGRIKQLAPNLSKNAALFRA
jgi:hypothetical protein